MNVYRDFFFFIGTTKNPVPYGGLSTQNGHMNNYVGQLPNQSTSQVQSATVPPTNQMVNNQVHVS